MNGTYLHKTLLALAAVLAIFAGTGAAHADTACTIGNPCTLPWGGQILDGQSITGYQAASVACGSSCVGQTRSCSNGTLSGTYTYQSCSVAACGCSLPWGGSINDGQSATAYQYASVPYGNTCGSQTRSCSNGTLSGSYSYQSCTVQAAASCSLPWGGSISNGQSVTAYAASSVAYGSSCSSQTRSCSNGTLSGSYSYQSCSVQAPANCTLPWGGTLAHGSSVTAYAAANVPYGSSCTSQTRSCNNGSLSGSYTNQSCTVAAPASCGATTYTWSTYCSGSVAAKASGNSETVTNTTTNYTGSVTASCGNGSWSYSGASCTYTGGSSGGGCFLGDTYVLMANGTSKLIENLKVGDLVASPHGANRVLGMDVHHKKQKIYAFNGGKPFVTGEHILFTTTGPRVIDPALAKKEAAYYDGLYHTHANTQVLDTLRPGKLKVGDVIKMANGQLLPIRSITWVEKKVYTLFNPALDGNHLYYANGLLVHNLKCAPTTCGDQEGL